ncbi:MAG: PqqD family protein [Paracoccus sp. (in: a-proteobacteria)]|nr:PqqD family protein [Paracoccus sp. (in: a-proteobacteria)]
MSFAAQITNTQFLQFEGLSGPVRLERAAQVGEGLRRVLHGWPHQKTTKARAEPVSTVTRDGATFTVASPWLDEPFQNLPAASAVCAVLADISEAFFDARPGLPVLHCGAFETGGRLIALTGHAHAGKSTLMARITAETDLITYCDDILPLDADGNGMALGAAPRLRLPLPATVSGVFRAHVGTYRGPHDDEYCYVCAPTVAAHGRRAPLAALIVLDRRADAPAALHEVSQEETIHHLLTQNMGEFATAGQGYAHARDLAERLICLRLVYSDLEDAVALLRRAFVGHEGVNTAVEIRAALPPLEEPLQDAAPADPATVFTRAPKVALRRQGEALFLWQHGGATLFRLNTVAAAIWALLEIPGNAHDLVEVLAEAFPDQDYARLTGDVTALLGTLQDEGLIRAMA